MRTARVVALIGVVAACAPASPPAVPPADRLVRAVEHDSLAVALRLLTDGVDPDAPATTGRLALNEAVRFGRDSLAAELLATGANPLLRDGDGHSAYDRAILNETPAMFDRLMVWAIHSAGGGTAVDDWMRSVGWPPTAGDPRWHEVLSGELLSLGLMHVALHGIPDEARQLRRAREIPNRTGYHALAVAARWGREPMVRALLAIDVQPDLPTTAPEGYTALSFARMGGHLRIVEWLEAAGARSGI